MKVAVYGGRGTGDPTRLGVEAFLTWAGIAWREIGPDEVANVADGEFDGIYVPGGWAWAYVRDIPPSGKGAIRRLVEQGGFYIGVCAGAYFATDMIRWECRFVEYDLDLFRGMAEGPIDQIQPWRGWRLTPLLLNGGHELHGGEERHEALYWGGPAFTLDPRQPATLLATYEATGEAAAVTFPYGKGQVLLMGCHLELGWNPEAKAFDLDGGHGAQWPWLGRAVRWTAAQAGRAE